jgi:hypothetical protein
MAQKGGDKAVRPYSIIVSVVVIVFGISLLNGCRRVEIEVSSAPPARPGPPPPHAPAHGYRAKHVYYYYPSTYVYYEPARGVYFYYENGHWRVGATLPSRVRISVGERVVIEMDSDRPYVQFEAHKKQYPPGHVRKTTKPRRR